MGPYNQWSTDSSMSCLPCLPCTELCLPCTELSCLLCLLCTELCLPCTEQHELSTVSTVSAVHRRAQSQTAELSVLNSNSGFWRKAK